ncbi:helix-turn-helix domain-containing protein [Bradyrhizobium sp. DASA03007]|uniref:helix-turn-helix domain-containing protein n=1 Tax=unclassified Bradyrhizobium TaxID=2631580 RepID=UPI003F718118
MKYIEGAVSRTNRFLARVHLRETFVTSLGRLRNARRWSQIEPSFKAEISRSYLSNLEKVRNVGIKIIGRLADTFPVAPAEFLKRHATQPPRRHVAIRVLLLHDFFSTSNGSTAHEVQRCDCPIRRSVKLKAALVQDMIAAGLQMMSDLVGIFGAFSTLFQPRAKFVRTVRTSCFPGRALSLRLVRAKWQS